MIGKIHSLESFGTKDGPGIRFVFFLQGCPLRCLYCHNPDTWHTKSSRYQMSPEEAFQEVARIKSFLSGGVTVSGGEPMLQADFVLEFFKLCKENGIHTAIDTSGIILNDKVKAVLKYTDLVLLDIKHIHPQKYKTLTGQALSPTLLFLDYLNQNQKTIWLRYVLVPGYSDEEEDLHAWAKYVSAYKTVERVDILPFHQMGIHKWKEIGEEYQLKDVNPPDKQKILNTETIFKSYGLPVV